MFPKSHPTANPSLTETMVKVRLEIEDAESETRNPLTSREERHSIDLVHDSAPNLKTDSQRDEDRSMLGSLHMHNASMRESMYAPDPPDAAKRPSVLLTVAGFILVTEFCERLAFYGFAGSLVLFFQTELGYTNAISDVQFSAWSGVCYITPLLGGYIADTYLGRYKTILIFCCIYLMGLVMVVIGSAPGDVNAAFFFPAIYIIALGTGGIKPNVSTMGADQFDERYSRDRLEMQSFFNWFYWMVNLGALIAYSVVAYFCQYGLPSAGGAKWGFFLGYMIPAVAMFVGILIFLTGTPKYVMKRPAGSVVAVALNIVYDACVLKYAKARPSTGHVLDKANEVHGGSFPDRTVTGVKFVARLMPFLLVLIPFWGIYSQMSTAFQNQACQMDLRLGSGVNMPVTALNSFDTIAILVLVPVFDRVIYPKIAAWLGRSVGMLEKIGAGLCFAILAMCVAAIVEAARLSYAPAQGNYYDVSARDNFTPCQSLRDYNPFAYQAYLAGVNTDDSSSSDTSAPLYCSQTCHTYYTDPSTNYQMLNLTCIHCDDLPQMSRLSVFWQIPQFFLIGIAEILTSITSLEFFYSQAPTAMRSVTQSLNLATTALGSFLVIPLLLLVNEANPQDPWVPANLDEGHLSWYFTLLASLMALTLLWFMHLARGYEYKTSAELSVLDDVDQTTGDRLLSSASSSHNNQNDTTNGYPYNSNQNNYNNNNITSSLHSRLSHNNLSSKLNNNDSNKIMNNNSIVNGEERDVNNSDSELEGVRMTMSIDSRDSTIPRTSTLVTNKSFGAYHYLEAHSSSESRSASISTEGTGRVFSVDHFPSSELTYATSDLINEINSAGVNSTDNNKNIVNFDMDVSREGTGVYTVITSNSNSS